MSAEAKKATLARRVDEDITLIYPRTLADIVLTSDDNVTVQDKINIFQNNINTLNSSVGDINTSIASLSSTIESNKTIANNGISNLNQRIDNLKGANILLGTDANTTVKVAIDDINNSINTLNASDIKYSSGTETVKDHIDNLDTDDIIYSGDTKLSAKLGNIDSEIESLRTSTNMFDTLFSINMVSNKYPVNTIFSNSNTDSGNSYMFLRGELISILNKPLIFKLKEACFYAGASYSNYYSASYQDIFKDTVVSINGSQSNINISGQIIRVLSEVTKPSTTTQYMNDPVIVTSTSNYVGYANIDFSIGVDSNCTFSMNATLNSGGYGGLYFYIYSGGSDLANFYFI